MTTDTGRLSLTRRAGESVLIGSDIRIEVAKITQGHVQLVIVAPKSIKILRNEHVEKAEAPCQPLT